jgi:hypothetical protein
MASGKYLLLPGDNIIPNNLTMPVDVSQVAIASEAEEQQSEDEHRWEHQVAERHVHRFTPPGNYVKPRLGPPTYGRGRITSCWILGTWADLVQHHTNLGERMLLNQTERLPEVLLKPSSVFTVLSFVVLMG